MAVDSSIDVVGNVSSFIIGLQEDVLIAAIVFMPDFYSAFFMSFVATFIGGFAVTGSHNLIVEQVPKSRGTMMSISGVFASIGVTIGSACGGLALTQGFQILGLTLGIFAVIAALIILLSPKNRAYPLRTQFLRYLNCHFFVAASSLG